MSKQLLSIAFLSVTILAGCGGVSTTGTVGSGPGRTATDVPAGTGGNNGPGAAAESGSVGPVNGGMSPGTSIGGRP